MPVGTGPSIIRTLNTEKQEDELEYPPRAIMWSDPRYFCRRMLTLDVPVLANYTDYYTAGRAISEPDNDLETLCASSSRTLLMS